MWPFPWPWYEWGSLIRALQPVRFRDFRCASATSYRSCRRTSIYASHRQSCWASISRRERLEEVSQEMEVSQEWKPNSAWSGSQSPSWLAMSGDYRCQRVHSGENSIPEIERS
jgi:hypothetical protein